METLRKQKLRSATAIYEDSETWIQKKKSHLDICWRMMMVTRISLSNQPRRETGSTGGFWVFFARHSVRAQRTARKRQHWGSVVRCFAAAAAVVVVGGAGKPNKQRRREPPSPQHRLQFPFESDDACARLPQHSDVARLSAPVCSQFRTS